jgi:hypothetical protein
VDNFYPYSFVIPKNTYIYIESGKSEAGSEWAIGRLNQAKIHIDGIVLYDENHQ